jgi:hypothetical protein
MRVDPDILAAAESGDAGRIFDDRARTSHEREQADAFFHSIGAKPNGAPPALVEFTATSLLDEETRPPQLIIPRLLGKGLTILGGRPKAGKSWLSLQLAIAVVEGQPFAGKLPVDEPSGVLYLGLEEPRWRTAERIRSLHPHPSDNLDWLRFVYRIEPLMAGGAAQLREHLKAHPAGVVVIDSFLALRRLEAKRAGDVAQADYNAINTLHDLALEHDSAIVLVHHTRKGTGDEVDDLMGTSGISAACDCVWILRRQPDNEGTLRVLGRELEDTRFGLRFDLDHGGWAITGEGLEVGLSEARTEILELLRAEGALKPARIATLLRKNANTVRRLLSMMAFEDTLRRDRSGAYYVTREGT